MKITSKATIFEKTTILKKKILHFAAPSLLGASLFKKNIKNLLLDNSPKFRFFRILKHYACLKEVPLALVLISKSRRHLPYLLGPVSSFAFYQKRIPLNAFNGEKKHTSITVD